MVCNRFLFIENDNGGGGCDKTNHWLQLVYGMILAASIYIFFWQYYNHQQFAI
jgi:hypothetical protein